MCAGQERMCASFVILRHKIDAWGHLSYPQSCCMHTAARDQKRKVAVPVLWLLALQSCPPRQWECAYCCRHQLQFS